MQKANGILRKWISTEVSFINNITFIEYSETDILKIGKNTWARNAV